MPSQILYFICCCYNQFCSPSSRLLLLLHWGFVVDVDVETLRTAYTFSKLVMFMPHEDNFWLMVYHFLFHFPEFQFWDAFYLTLWEFLLEWTSSCWSIAICIFVSALPSFLFRTSSSLLFPGSHLQESTVKLYSLENSDSHKLLGTLNVIFEVILCSSDHKRQCWGAHCLGLYGV